MKRTVTLLLAVILAASACTSGNIVPGAGNAFSEYFEILPSGAVVSVSPYTGERDTLALRSGPETHRCSRIVCMSSSHVAFLRALGADSVIVGVSGKRFLSDPAVRENPDIEEIGHEAAFDYEAVMRLNPDVVLAYKVSSVDPQYISKLKSLGIRTLTLYEHLESHPLARAEYIRLAGALVGKQELADSIFTSVVASYNAIADQVPAGNPQKVLVNLPYSDQWYVPGKDNYMSRLISDAGGEILGAGDGTASSVISIERAYYLSHEADFWLNPGQCRSRADIVSLHPLFASFGPMSRRHTIYNNTARSNPAGGNDFWEGGVVRPDLILEDLVRIFGSAGAPFHENDGPSDGTLHYYIEIE